MTVELDFEKGIEEARKIIGKCEINPILVAVFGWSDNGKSYFIDDLEGRLSKEGMNVCGYGCAPTVSTFAEVIPERLIHYPELIFTYLLHCGWLRTPYGIDEHENPNILAPKYLGKELDLNVAVYNPNMQDKPDFEELYDIIISNPNSVRKREFGD